MTHGSGPHASGQRRTPRLRQLGGAALLLTLSACGGGSDSGSGAGAAGPAAAASVPDSAYESTPAFMRFIASMSPDDRAEPLRVGEQMPPTDDRAQPWDGTQ